MKMSSFDFVYAKCIKTVSKKEHLICRISIGMGELPIRQQKAAAPITRRSSHISLHLLSTSILIHIPTGKNLLIIYNLGKIRLEAGTAHQTAVNICHGK